MDIHIHSVDTLKNGDDFPKSKGKTFRVEGFKPEFSCKDTYLLITGENTDCYYNQSAVLFNRENIAPDRDITRTGRVFISKSEILCLLKTALESNFISNDEISECIKSENVERSGCDLKPEDG
jgi:hypothetical protein